MLAGGSASMSFLISNFGLNFVPILGRLLGPILGKKYLRPVKLEEFLVFDILFYLRHRVQGGQLVGDTT